VLPLCRMQGRQQICILCRNIGRPARIILHNRREASQLRSLEPYDATKLILDLDAADSKYVRKLDDRLEYKTQLPPLPPRNSPKAIVEAKARKKSRTLLDPKDVPDIYRPAPIDFMKYALDTVCDRRKKGPLRKILSKCLPVGLGKFEDHIKWLRAYEVLPYKVEKLLRGPNEQAVQGIESALNYSTSIDELSRITSLLARTVEGCKFVALNGTLFLGRIGMTPPSNLKGQRTGTHKKLKYINAVIQRLETMGVDAGPQWYRAGLENAVKALHSPALKKYIDIAFTRKDMFKLQRTLEHTVAWSFDVRDIEENNSMTVDLLKLLTGWENLGVPEGDEHRKPCFALLLNDDLGMYEAYIDALDKLGAYNALWHEFYHLDSPQVSPRTSRSDNERVGVFDRVLTRLRSPLEALKVLNKQGQARSSGKEELVPSSSARQIPSNETHIASSNEGNFPSRSILSTPGLDQDRRMKLRRALANKYLTTEFYDINEQSLLKALKNLELYTPENMSDIVSVLSAYWTENEDQKIRKLVAGHELKSSTFQRVIMGIDRRLDAIAEEWESRGDISSWYVSEDVQRLKQLRNDLHNPKP
jgi:hypothetical protein